MNRLGIGEHEACDIAIVGAGAAGIMAGIFAGRTAPRGTRIVALDTAAKLGAKILVSGGGRCNVTHHVVKPTDYAGASNNQIKKVLNTFGVAQTIEFFNGLGVELKREDTGKLFPVTDKAHTVREALLTAMRDAHVQLWTDARVHSLKRNGQGFRINDSLDARKVIVATGGLALPKTGSDGTGYQLLRSLGHRITDTTPALVPLRLPKGHWLTDLSGISLDVELTLASRGGKVMRRQRGPMLATHFGLSGPAVMDISRHWIAAQPDGQLGCNLLPDISFSELEAQMIAHRTGTLANWLKQYLPQRWATTLLHKQAQVDPAIEMTRLGRDDRRAALHALTALPLPITGDRGYTFAEVTAGGVPLEEVDLKTMASRVCEGLYLCGEVLNVDGRIGGYNFQWAWCTGRLAGQASASHLDHPAHVKPLETSS